MFKRIASSLSRISADQYLLIVVLSLIVLSYANLLFSTLMYEFGYGAGFSSPLAGPGDRLADLVKLSFSYRPFVSGVELKTFQTWPDIFKNYFFYPIYGGKEALAAGQVITHFHLPPLQTLIFIACASLISHTQSVFVGIATFYGLYLVTIQRALLVGIPAEKRTTGVSLATWFIAVLSYPALLVFSRGNIQSGITSLLIIAFMLSLFLRNRVETAALLSLAIAVNIRPNAVIFALAIPLVLGLEQSFKPMLYFGALASGIFASSYFVTNWLYPDYTLSTFLQGLAVYKKLYVVGSMGDGANSSLWALLKNYGTISANVENRIALITLLFAILLAALFWGLRHLSHWMIVAPVVLIILYAQFVAITGHRQYFSVAYIVFSVLLAAVAGWGLWFCPKRTLVAPFVLTALYCLFCPVFADYHLLVFLGPVLLLYFNPREWADNSRPMAAIALASILVLSPKNYVGMSGLSLQTIFNPLILYVATLYVVREARYISPSPVADGPLEAAESLAGVC